MTLATSGIEFVPFESAGRHSLAEVRNVWSALIQMFDDRPQTLHGILILRKDATMETIIHGAPYVFDALRYFRTINQLGSNTERPFLILDSFKDALGPTLVVLFKYAQESKDGTKSQY